MAEISAKEPMLTLPPQRRGVPRLAHPGASLDRSGAVSASQSRCDGLTGTEKSLCYALVYGVDL
jgi:hypothetical protein